LNESIILALITAGASITVAYLTSRATAKKASTKAVSDGAIKLENRLTKIETTLKTELKWIKDNMITREERACIVEVQTSLNWALTTMLGDAVSGLKNPPSLDLVFDKLEKEIEQKGSYKAVFGVLDNLTVEQDEELTAYLEKTIKSDRSHIKRQRARMILGLKKLGKDLKEKGASCDV
jgi:hypothetical protein